MGAYQQSPGGTPGWGGAPAPAGNPELQQTAAPHLRPGETLIGVFPGALDPLLPLSFHQDVVGGPNSTTSAPRSIFLSFLWGLWRGFWVAILPRWAAELIFPSIMRRQTYGMRMDRAAYRAMRRPLHGGAWSGGDNSTARHFWKAVRTTPGEQNKADHDLFTLVLTDQRMLLLSRHQAYQREQAYQALALLELPRGTYGLRRDAPGSWFTDRLDLAFGDGSWIALNMYDKDDAKQCAALLG
ncbi:hypothetical protein [Streptomyces sioyaensis]|uniref:hypothetical protein n=1 Tax=Streptomyces sioyaensis TaxID=67364 RepID=UPI0037A2FFFA